MTGPLRRAHRAIWFALPGALAAILMAGLWARRDPLPANPHWSWEERK
jgi:hypothetical protein